jgi:hypothetical protein
VSIGRAHRIAVDALGRDAFAAPALDRIVNAQDHRTAGHEGLEQQTQQPVGAIPFAPAGPAEHAMVVHEMALPAEAGDPQDARDRALARCQDRAEEQHLGVPPTALEEEWREG